MSEYQFYEFAAIDGPVSEEDTPYPWSVSSRATVTPWRWRNIYNWGDFRGSVERMMQCYDAHVYLANWGSFRFMLAFPTDMVSLPLGCLADAADCFSVRQCAGRMVLCWSRLMEEYSDSWIDGGGLLDLLLPIREEILRGDHRAVYLGWLGWASQFHDREDMPQHLSLEPPVPPGLSQLTSAQSELADQLAIPADLLAAAATLDLPAPDRQAALRRRLADARPEELLDYLLRVANGEHARVAMELNRLANATCRPDRPGPRSVGELWKLADRLGARRRAQEDAERERLRLEREAKRNAFLLDLLPGEEALWSEADMQAGAGKPSLYNHIAALLCDLRDACALVGRSAEFAQRIQAFRAKHARKRALLRRITDI